MERYKKICQIGEGAFGKVYKSKDIENMMVVAIKRIPLDPENGIPFTAYREIKVLKKYKHKNLVTLHDIRHEEGFIFLVMDYLPYDLTGLILSKYNFEPKQILGLIHQLCQATAYLHSKNLVHRDIKASNILIDEKGVLKLTDFGLTREQSPYMTNRVCTLWYRAPELLLGEIKYCAKVDSWSIGILMLEMKLGTPPFKGNNEASQIKEIVKNLGIPNEKLQWSELFDIQKYKKNENFADIIHDLYGSIFDVDELQLLKELLALNAKERISPQYALKLSCLKNLEEIHFPIKCSEVHEFDKKNKEN